MLSPCRRPLKQLMMIAKTLTSRSFDSSIARRNSWNTCFRCSTSPSVPQPRSPYESHSHEQEILKVKYLTLDNHQPRSYSSHFAIHFYRSCRSNHFGRATSLMCSRDPTFCLTKSLAMHFLRRHSLSVGNNEMLSKTFSFFVQLFLWVSVIISVIGVFFYFSFTFNVKCKAASIYYVRSFFDPPPLVRIFVWRFFFLSIGCQNFLDPTSRTWRNKWMQPELAII